MIRKYKSKCYDHRGRLIKTSQMNDRRATDVQGRTFNSQPLNSAYTAGLLLKDRRHSLFTN